MNTQDKDNIQKIENERARLLKAMQAGNLMNGGALLNINGSSVEFELERLSTHCELARFSYVFCRFSELNQKATMDAFTIAYLESDFMASADLYKVATIGLKALKARGL